jgi:hypothetical protein
MDKPPPIFTDEDLPTMTHPRFTRVVSSSHNHADEAYQQTRQFILDAIKRHLHSHQLSPPSIWSAYENIDTKFSASISPSVYRHFERIVS